MQSWGRCTAHCDRELLDWGVGWPLRQHCSLKMLHWVLLARSLFGTGPRTPDWRHIRWVKTPPVLAPFEITDVDGVSPHARLHVPHFHKTVVFTQEGHALASRAERSRAGLQQQAKCHRLPFSCCALPIPACPAGCLLSLSSAPCPAALRNSSCCRSRSRSPGSPPSFSASAL